jgi:hypothetical protein
MDLMQSFRTLRKRAKLTVTLLLLTLVLTIGAAVKLPWSYQSVGNTVLLDSKAEQATFGNPYLSFDEALELTANILCLQLTGSTTALALQAQGYTGSYTATVPSATGAPMIQITVTASSPAAAQNTMHAVMGQVSTQLLALQGNVAPKNRIVTQVISMTPNATKLTSKKAKPLVVLLGLGLVFTFAIPQLVERSAARRRARRGADDVSGRADTEVPRRERVEDYREAYGAYADEPVSREPVSREPVSREPVSREPVSRAAQERDGRAQPAASRDSGQVRPDWEPRYRPSDANWRS